MDKNLLSTIDLEKVPQHVAIIMDGNGRWAKKHGRERTFGHRNAIDAVSSAINSCNELNIKYLTLFAFSSENWNRPKAEVSLLMRLLSQTIKKELNNLINNDIRLRVIGEWRDLPSAVVKNLEEGIEKTKDNRSSNLIIALSYGAKNEILRAVKTIAQDVKNSTISLDQINENLFRNYLYTQEIPDVDLMIRTSGEYRISNFMLWQIAYAELYFTPVLWPDFTKEEFYKAIIHYQSRERRFGKTSDQING